MTRKENCFLKIVFITVMLPAIFSAVNAQVTQKTGTGSIAGQIKIGERTAPGVAVTLISSGAPNAAPNAAGDTGAKVSTDGEGRYLIANLTAGRYRVYVMAPGYVISGNAPTVQVSEGQSVTGVDFVLAKGGVITGKVTGKGDRPLIGEQVNLTLIGDDGQPSQNSPGLPNNFRTDDRGIYRIYGVPAGKYLVSAGRGDGNGGGQGPGGGFVGPGRGGFSSAWQRTYYPEATDASQATVVEVESEKETTGIDIHMVVLETYAISGRVVDAETGQPVAGVLIGHGRTNIIGDRGGGRSSGGNNANGTNNSSRQIVMGGVTDGTSSAEGEFRIEGLSRGDYAVYAAQDQSAGQTEFYSDPVGVQVSANDVNGIEIKLKRGASITGFVVFEGADSNTLANLTNIIVTAQSRMGRGGGANTNTDTASVGTSSGSSIIMATNPSSQVSGNGSFRISGLTPGAFSLNVTDQRSPGPFSGLTILQIERNGANARSGIAVQYGEQVTGVRIVLAYGNSTIRGVVKAEGGTLTPDMRLMVFARRIDPNSTEGGARGGMQGGIMPSQVDAGGNFQIDKLVAGTYEVSVQMMGGPGRPGGGGGVGGVGPGGQFGQGGGRSRSAPQTVVIGSNAVKDVIIPLNITAATPNPQGNQNGGNQGAGTRRGGRP